MIEADIITALEKPGHVRKLAREIGVSPSYIHRKLAELEAEGMVVSEQVGRRLVYSLVEENPLVQSFRSLKTAEDFVSRFGRYSAAVFAACHLLKEKFGDSLVSVKVFGSVAKSSWEMSEKKKSDLDIAVVVRSLPVKFTERIKMFTGVSLKLLLKYNIKTDIIPYDLKDIKFRDEFRDEIARTGITVYGDDGWT